MPMWEVEFPTPKSNPWDTSWLSCNSVTIQNCPPILALFTKKQHPILWVQSYKTASCPRLQKPVTKSKSIPVPDGLTINQRCPQSFCWMWLICYSSSQNWGIFCLQDYQFITKGCNSRRTGCKWCRKPGLELPCSQDASLSEHLHLFTNPEALQPVLWVFHYLGMMD